MQHLIEVAQRPAKMLGNGLHPEAHPQRRQAVRCGDGDDAHQLAGFIGDAWARRQDQAIELDNRVWVDRVIAHHIHPCTRTDEDVFDVPCKGIVIVYQ